MQQIPGESEGEVRVGAPLGLGFTLTLALLGASPR